MNYILINTHYKCYSTKKEYHGKDTILKNSWRTWKYSENLHNGCEREIDQTSAFRLMAEESLGNWGSIIVQDVR